MWVVKTNSKQVFNGANLLDSLHVFISECEQAETIANASNPVVVSLIQQVQQDNGAIVQFPYFTNSYR